MVGVVGGVVVCGRAGLLIGLVSLRLRGVYFAIFTLAVAEMFFIYFGRLSLTQRRRRLSDHASCPSGSTRRRAA